MNCVKNLNKGLVFESEDIAEMIEELCEKQEFSCTGNYKPVDYCKIDIPFFEPIK